jgi:type II secretory pathway component GspD/PulD (secretin)
VKSLILFTFLLVAATATGTAFGASFKEACPDLKKCIENVGELTGKKYLFQEKIKGKILASSNVELTSANADTLLSHSLNQLGYTRVPLNIENTYSVINSRDIRYTPTIQTNATKKQAPKIPNVDDYYMVSYKASHPQITTVVTRALRPFMSRYGRIIDNKMTGTIILQDTANNIHRLYKLIVAMDVKPKKNLVTQWKHDSKMRWKERIAEAGSVKCRKEKGH